MANNKILFDVDLAKVKVGMDLVHKAVTGTIGAAGRNIMFRDWSNEPVITNDGFTIAELISPEDESERMGADFLKQASRRQNMEAGDGTTTVIALSHAMIEKGAEKVAEGVNHMKLKREMDASVDGIIKRLRVVSHKIKTDKELFDVANLSMENPKMAELVVESVKNAGENGRVVVQESNLTSTKTEEVKGIDFSRGYISPYMINNPFNLTAELEDVHVLVADKEFNLMKQVFPIMEGLKAKGIDKLLVVCKNVIGEALGNMIANIQKNAFYCVAVQVPDNDDLLDDIATLTGAQKINEVNTPDALTPMHINYLGKAKKVIVHRDKTIIDSGNGKMSDIEERVKGIQNELKDAEGQRKEQLKDRLAKLAGKVVYIKVGAPTQQEMKYLKLKMDDAVASAALAKKSGVVIGGGRALYDISLEKPKTDGEEVVFKALAFPMRKIIENAKRDPDDVLKTLKKGEAWNSLTEQPVKDYLKEGIVDATDIEVWAVKNAVSVATMWLTTFGSIVKLSPVKCCGDKSDNTVQ